MRSISPLGGSWRRLPCGPRNPCFLSSLSLLLLLLLFSRISTSEDGDLEHSEYQSPSDAEPAAEKRKSQKVKKAVEQQQQQPECRWYMAESAIPGAGLGIYTAAPVRQGQIVYHGDMLLVVSDLVKQSQLRRRFLHKMEQQEKNQGTNYYYDDRDTPVQLSLLENIFWDPVYLFKHQYEEYAVKFLFAGLGMLINSHPALYNTDVAPYPSLKTIESSSHDEVPHWSAYTDFGLPIRYKATANLSAGTELYAKYGDSWVEKRTPTGIVPLSKDYQAADRLLGQFWDTIQGDVNHPQANELWQSLLETTSWQTRLHAAMPKDLAQVQQVITMGGTAAYSVPNQVRSLDWLQQHGYCLDHIQPGPSRIPGIGRGAVATRALSQGQVIAPLRMVHFQRHFLELYQQTNPWMPDQIEHIGSQLILNYCFGHVNSSLLMIPSSPVVHYLNHHATEYNAQLQWPQFSGLLPHHPQTDWFQYTPEQLDRLQQIGFLMELVALRDITPGEEVLINYGPAWQEAWDDYRQQHEAAPLVTATELNNRRQWVRTQEELLHEPYPGPPDAIFTACFAHGYSRIMDEGGQGRLPVLEWAYTEGLFKDYLYLHECTILVRQGQKSLPPLDDDDAESNALSMARDNEPNDNLYSAQIHFDASVGGDQVFVNLPRLAIRFLDSVQQGSAALTPHAFRHEMQFHDHLMPAAWLDLAESSGERN